MIYMPTVNAESWKIFLADPEKQWKTGFSAKLAAESWEKSKGLPSEIFKALNKNENLIDSEMLLAIPEFKVPLPGGKRPSQNDVLAVLSNEKGLSLITVEAKAKENFDNLVEVWNKDQSEGKRKRLDFLLDKTNFPNKDFQKLRYQLFHRLASAIIMAEKFHAKNAIMVIQSFVSSDLENHYDDFSNFVKAYNRESNKENPIFITEKNGIDVYVLWVQSPQ